MVNAIFFDRDGVITAMVPRTVGAPTAPWTRQEFRILPDVLEAFRLLPSAFLKFVVTNQPDILDGNLQRGDLQWFHRQIRNLLPITEIRHAEVRGSSQYKPNPGMVLDLINQYDVDPSQSFMVGDRWKDIVCGKRAKLTTIFIGDKYNDGGSGVAPDHVVANIYDACYIMSR